MSDANARADVRSRLCSFCGATNPDRRTMIHGNGHCICDDCVSLCVEMVEYARGCRDRDASMELLR